MTPTAEKQVGTPPSGAQSLAQILCNCAFGAAVNAFLVLLFGNIAFSIVSGIVHNMTPSLPPGFNHPKWAEATSGTQHAWHFPAQFRFLLLFAILFSVSVWARLGLHLSGHAMRAQKLSRHISNQWFGLIVGNAFGALFAAMVVSWVQRFSLSQIVFQWVWNMIWVPIQAVVAHVFGESGGALQAWFNWYGANQFKFSFWFLYITAICDDLGVPNLKTGARFLWHRFRNRRASTCAAPAAVIPISVSTSDEKAAELKKAS